MRTMAVKLLAIREHLGSPGIVCKVGVARLVSFLCCVVFCLRPVSFVPYIASLLNARSVSSNNYLIDIWTLNIYKHMVLETKTFLKEPVVVAKS